MSADVAIAGIGLHPFGRHDDVSGMAMGVHAVRAALQDAGLQWGDVEFAYGGSEDAGNADTSDDPPVAHPFFTLTKGSPVGPRSLTIVSALPPSSLPP